MQNITEATLTEDGTLTLYSEKYQEHFHSLTGAYTEALEKFVKPSGILESTEKKRILDVCFGLGYNSLTTLEQYNQSEPINIIALEKYKSVIEQATQLTYPFCQWNQVLKQLYHQGECQYKKGLIKLLLGDARSVIQNISVDFDIIYLDPFSTQKNVELWTADFFALLKSKLRPDGLLLTYSSALPVRSGLLRSQFHVYESKPVGRRRGGTIASPNSLSDKLELSEMEQLLLKFSVGKIPYRDLRLQMSSTQIFDKRNKLMNYLLKKNKILKVKECYKKRESLIPSIL